MGDIVMDQNLTVDGSLTTGDYMSAKTYVNIKSDGTGSHVYMCGSGNPNFANNHNDVDICMTGGIANQDKQGHLWVNSQGYHSRWWFKKY